MLLRKMSFYPKFLIPEHDGFGKKIIFRGGLIMVRRDNYSIIHTRLIKNNKKAWCLEKKTGIYGLLRFVLLELNVQVW